MTELTIVSIVEGHGELDALPILIRRVAALHSPGVAVIAPRPIRSPRSKLLKQGELERAVSLAAYKVSTNGGVVVVLDADDDCPAKLAPELLARAQEAARGRFEVRVILPKFEYEAWFLAAALSLRGKRGLSDEIRPPADPEAIRDAKGWLTKRMETGDAYSEVVDQPALASVMSLDEARRGSRSFDKFYRDVTTLIDGILDACGRTTDA